MNTPAQIEAVLRRHGVATKERDELRRGPRPVPQVSAIIQDIKALAEKPETVN